MKIVSHLNHAVKLIVLTIAVLLVIGSSNGKEFKVRNNNLNLSTDLTLMALRVEEDIKNDIYSAKDTFTGHLTGYVYNCPLCNGTLGCKRSYDITDGKDYYDDYVYGRVKIVASSSNLPCGSIVRIYSKRIADEPTLAIVLDRGVRGNALDLLSPTLEYAYGNIGRSTVTYDVLRFGYGNNN